MGELPVFVVCPSEICDDAFKGRTAAGLLDVQQVGRVNQAVMVQVSMTEARE